MADIAHHIRMKPKVDIWTVAALVLAGLLLLPIFAVLWMVFFPTDNIWPHLMQHALPRY